MLNTIKANQVKNEAKKSDVTFTLNASAENIDTNPTTAADQPPTSTGGADFSFCASSNCRRRNLFSYIRSSRFFCEYFFYHQNI